MTDREPTVVDRPDEHRYELHIDGAAVSLATYRLDERVMTIPHVETATEHRGQGFADILMAGIVDDVRRRGLTIRPLCPFAAGHMNDHPDTHDLIAS